MNILCISYEYPPIGGGGGPVCQGICEAVVGAGHNVDVVTSAMADLPTRETRNGVELYRTKCRRKHRHFTTAAELLTGLLPAYREAMRLTRIKQYDLIHCHFVVPSGVVACAVAKRTGLPYILTAHGSDIPGYNPDRFDLMHRIISPAWRRILKRADAVTTPSNFLKELLQQKIDIPVDIIPNGFTPPPAPDVERRNRILAVTRMFERKGIQHVVEAMRGLDCDWELTIVGDGPYLPKLKQIAADMRVNADFRGYVQGQELIDLYHSAKIYALPSSSENFPVVLLEALAAGCAVITTEGTGCAEVVGPAAITVPVNDAEAIRAGLEKLISDENEIKRLQAIGYERVERFHWRHIGQDFDRLFTHHARITPQPQESSTT